MSTHTLPLTGSALVYVSAVQFWTISTTVTRSSQGTAPSQTCQVNEENDRGNVQADRTATTTKRKAVSFSGLVVCFLIILKSCRKSQRQLTLLLRSGQAQPVANKTARDEAPEDVWSLPQSEICLQWKEHRGTATSSTCLSPDIGHPELTH